MNWILWAISRGIVVIWCSGERIANSLHSKRIITFFIWLNHFVSQCCYFWIRLQQKHTHTHTLITNLKFPLNKTMLHSSFNLPQICIYEQCIQFEPWIYLNLKNLNMKIRSTWYYCFRDFDFVQNSQKLNTCHLQNCIVT